MDEDHDSAPKVLPKPDGPYLVSNLDNLTNRNGAIDTKPTIALCRCGGSANKPFCDGTHKSNDFSSEKLEGRVEDRRYDYVGEGITIHDNRGICAHSGRCTDGIPNVFRMRIEPWINADGASPEDVVATIRQCPSGALSYFADGEEHQDLEAAPAISVSPDGPYVVTGGPELIDTEFGEGASREHYTLCRCGGSKNKPFCDGTHWHIKFKDDNN